MADTKLADMTAIDAVSATDLLYAVKDPSGTPLDRKVTPLQMATYVNSLQTRATLALDTTDSPQFAGINLGDASDTTLTRPSAGNLAIEGNAVYRAGGTDVPLADGGTGASLTDPNADRVYFWDDSAGSTAWLTMGTNLTITGTTLDATGGGSGDMLSTLTSAEIATTQSANTTLTISRMHVCTGTTIDYTVTLPAASGNAGKFIGIRMSPALTKFVTVDGNASETIDGALTRLMWAQETAILQCDGSNWFKVAGKAVPMQCTLYLSASQGSVAHATMTKVNLDTAASDNTSRMADLASNRAVIKRAGTYIVSGETVFTLSAAATRVITQLRKNAAQISTAEVGAPFAGNPAPVAFSMISWAVADTVELAGYHTTTVPEAFYGGAAAADGGCQLNIIEAPSW